MSYSWVFTPFVGDVDSLDHQAEAAANVLSQYPDSVRLLAFLDAFVDQAQSLEELSQDILVMRSVYTAEGVQLDTLGDIVGLERGELSDDASSWERSTPTGPTEKSSRSTSSWPTSWDTPPSRSGSFSQQASRFTQPV
jgi:hypothetical protein